MMKKIMLVLLMLCGVNASYAWHQPKYPKGTTKILVVSTNGFERHGKFMVNNEDEGEHHTVISYYNTVGDEIGKCDNIPVRIRYFASDDSLLKGRVLWMQTSVKMRYVCASARSARELRDLCPLEIADVGHGCWERCCG